MTTSARTAPPPSLLRAALLLDAAVTGANGALYLAAAPALADLLGVPAGTLRWLGAVLLGFAAAVLLVGRRMRPAPPAVRAVVAVNAAWVAASLVAAATGWQSPTTTGTVWTVLQAGVVAAFAGLQLLGLRSSAGPVR